MRAWLRTWKCWGAVKQYSPYDLESGEVQQAIILAYVNQAAPDFKKKLQYLERLGERGLRDLVAVAEKVTIREKRRTRKKREGKKNIEKGRRRETKDKRGT